MFITRAVSLTNFLVATSALGFQDCVLYPWHKQLDDDFEALKKSICESWAQSRTLLREPTLRNVGEFERWSAVSLHGACEERKTTPVVTLALMQSPAQ